jgi:hypothetical protein
MKDDDLSPYERTGRNPHYPNGWESEGRLDANDVLGRLVFMALSEFGEDQGSWPMAFDDDGF